MTIPSIGKFNKQATVKWKILGKHTNVNMRNFSVVIFLCLILPVVNNPMRFNVEAMQRDLQSLLDKSNQEKNRSSKRALIIKEHTILSTYNQDRYSNCAVVMLYCRSGLYLAVQNGILRGMRKNIMEDRAGIFRIESYGKSIIRLKDMMSGMYIIMTDKGHVRLTKEKTQESLFLQHQEENHYITFSSEKYYINETNDLFISLKRNGKIRLARNTEPGQKSSQFLYIPQPGIPCS